MSLDNFINLYISWKRIDKTINDLYDLKIDIINSPLCDDIGFILDIALRTGFNETQVDLINAFLFEKLIIDGKEITDPYKLYDCLADYESK